MTERKRLANHKFPYPGAIGRIQDMTQYVTTLVQSLTIFAQDTVMVANDYAGAIETYEQGLLDLTDRVTALEDFLDQLSPQNFIVNPGMRFSQELGTTGSSTHGGTIADQWVMAASGATAMTGVQVASFTPGGSNYRTRLTITTGKSPGSAEWIGWVQPIEASRINDFKAGTANAEQVTIRFGFKAPAGTYTFSLRNGASNLSYTVPFTITSGQANTDTVQEFHIQLPTTGTWARSNIVGMFFTVAVAGGSTYVNTSDNAWNSGNFFVSPTATNGSVSGAVYELFDVGFYRGNISNPKFILPPYDQDMANCMRYYQTNLNEGQTSPAAQGFAGSTLLFITNLNAAAHQVGWSTSFIVPMRTSPAVTVYSTNTGNAGFLFSATDSTDKSASVDLISEKSFRAYATDASSSTFALYGHWKANARM